MVDVIDGIAEKAIRSAGKAIGKRVVDGVEYSGEDVFVVTAALNALDVAEDYGGVDAYLSGASAPLALDVWANHLADDYPAVASAGAEERARIKKDALLGTSGMVAGRALAIASRYADAAERLTRR